MSFLLASVRFGLGWSKPTLGGLAVGGSGQRPSHRGLRPNGPAQAVAKRDVTADGGLVAHGDREGASRARQHDELPGPGDAGVEQVALEEFGLWRARRRPARRRA